MAKETEIQEKYWVGQEGEFQLWDAFGHPSGTVQGRVVSLIKGAGYFYLLVETKQGLRPIQIL